MKSKTIVLSIFVMILLFAGTVCATDTLTTYITDSARLKISFISQDPDPVRPGDIVDVRWKVENLGSQNARDVVLKLQPEYPFSLLPGDDGIRDIGSVQGRQIDEEGVIILYKMKVDENAVEGETKLSLEYKYDFNNWIKSEETYPLRVQTIDASIAVESVQSEPKKIIPGNPAKVSFSIRNLADSYMKDITVKLDLTFSQYLPYINSIASTTAYLDALPFAPLGSTTEKRIDVIAPGKSVDLTYDLMTYPDAESRVYKVPITLTFYDELGEQHITNDVIGLLVGAVPELDVILESSTVHSPNTAGTITIKFVNRGITDVKFLNAKLERNKLYEVTSAESDYVGNVDSDDYENAEFEIFLRNPESDEVIFPVEVTYKDSNNNNYAKTVDLKLKLWSEEVRGEKKSSNLGWIIFAVIVIVAGWFIYRRWERKKETK